jgi:hypothetical protein
MGRARLSGTRAFLERERDTRIFSKTEPIFASVGGLSSRSGQAAVSFVAFHHADWRRRRGVPAPSIFCFFFLSLSLCTTCLAYLIWIVESRVKKKKKTEELTDRMWHSRLRWMLTTSDIFRFFKIFVLFPFLVCYGHPATATAFSYLFRFPVSDPITP